MAYRGRQGRRVTGDLLGNALGSDVVNESDVPSTAPADRRARRRLWPWLVGVVLGVAGAAAVLVGVFATQALAVRADLTEAKSRLADVVADVRAGTGVGAVDVRTARISALTERARETVDGPLWSLFSEIPVVGANVAAVRDVTEATDILVQDALPVGLQLIGTIDIDNLALDGGGVDLAPFVAAQSSLPALDDAFARAAATVDGIDRTALLPVVDDSIGQVLDAVTTGAPAIATLKEYLPTLLQMAGSEGPRRYLVVFQNLAETRATGGNPAASMVLTIDQGRMSFSDQASSTTFGTTEGTAYLDLPAETLALYEADTTSYEQNFTRTPDFPTTAALLRSAWQRTSGQDVDGVISIDPVVLTRILQVTGPVTVADGTELTADNAVRVLLSDTYVRFPAESAPADAFFAQAAAAVFAKITGGGWNPLDMLDQLSQAAADQRVYAWFTREGEEAVALDVGIDGSLAAPADGLEVGMFVNDSGYDKLGFYLSSSVQVTCDVAAGTTTTSITVTSAVPDQEFTWYVGNNRAPRNGYDRSTMFLDLLYVAPAGSSIVSSAPAAGDLEGWDRQGVDTGRQAWSRTVVLPRGESRTVSYTSTIPEGATGPVLVRHTPGIGATPVTLDASCDALAPAS